MFTHTKKTKNVTLAGKFKQLHISANNVVTKTTSTANINTVLSRPFKLDPSPQEYRTDRRHSKSQIFIDDTNELIHIFECVFVYVLMQINMEHSKNVQLVSVAGNF